MLQMTNRVWVRSHVCRTLVILARRHCTADISVARLARKAISVSHTAKRRVDKFVHMLIVAHIVRLLALPVKNRAHGELICRFTRVLVSHLFEKYPGNANTTFATCLAAR